MEACVLATISTGSTRRQASPIQRQLAQAIECCRCAESEASTLSTLLTICASCKRVRDDAGHWHRVEQDLESAGTVVTHGLCRDCAEWLYPEFGKN